LDIGRLADFDAELLALKMEAARARWGGVLPLVPEWIVDNEPDLFTGGGRARTEKAVKRALQNAGMLAGDMAQIPISNTMGFGPYPKPIEFNVAGRPGRPLKALMQPSHYGGELLLRSAIGARISKISGRPLDRNFAFAGWPRAWGPEPEPDSPLWDIEAAEAAVVDLRKRQRLADETRALPGYAFRAVLPVKSDIVFRYDEAGLTGATIARENHETNAGVNGT
jgi:hypothetical protein